VSCYACGCANGHYYGCPQIHAPDPINPAHYQGDYVMRIIEDFKLGFCLGNVIKYVLRAENKNGVECLKKARWYLDRKIKALEAVK